MRVAECYSLVPFLRLLLKVNPNHPHRVIQMEKDDFGYFMDSSKILHFNRIPYSKKNHLIFDTSSSSKCWNCKVKAKELCRFFKESNSVHER